jgi:S-(hydroxymethyl)glutathione dehydrogenase/alcohol dehydrogenase
MTHHSGRTVLVGVPNKETPASFQTLPLHLGQRLIGSHGGSAQPSIDIPRIAGLVKCGLLELGDFPKTFFKLENINEALESLRTGTLGRVLINM